MLQISLSGSEGVSRSPPGDLSVFDWLPSAGALAKSSEAIKEWIGFAAYKALGRL